MKKKSPAPTVRHARFQVIQDGKVMVQNLGSHFLVSAVPGRYEIPAGSLFHFALHSAEVKVITGKGTLKTGGKSVVRLKPTPRAITGFNVKLKGKSVLQVKDTALIVITGRLFSGLGPDEEPEIITRRNEEEGDKDEE